MPGMKLLAAILCVVAAAIATAPLAYQPSNNVTYRGFLRNGVEVFLGIPYAQDTAGANRFKPPQPFSFPADAVHLLEQRR